jgi:hypothetical protein
MLPAPLLASDSAVLVFAQTSKSVPRDPFIDGSRPNRNREYRPADTTFAVSARILKGRELPTLKDSLAQSSSSEIFLLICNGFSCGSGTIDRGREELQRLCLVTAEGVEIGLVPSGSAWTAGAPVQFGPARRDALAAAVGQGDPQAFDDVDGPCGMTGRIDWPAAMRHQVGTMLAAMPERPTSSAISPLEPLARKALAHAAADRGVLLLSVGRWRERRLVNPPLFLAAADFAPFEALMKGASGADLLAFFPDHFARHAAGRLIPGNFAIESFCAISDRGEVLYRSPPDGGWMRLPQSPPYRQWRKQSLDTLKGSAPPAAGGDACVPAKPDAWSPTELALALDFIASLPTQVAPHAASALVATFVQPTTSGGDVAPPGLVLVEIVDVNGVAAVVPLVIAPRRRPQEVGPILTWIGPDDLLSALPETLAIAGTNKARKLCIIAGSGALTYHVREEARNAWGDATMVTLPDNSPSAPDGAAVAMQRLLGRACGLTQRDWAGGTGERIRRLQMRPASRTTRQAGARA